MPVPGPRGPSVPAQPSRPAGTVSDVPAPPAPPSVPAAEAAAEPVRRVLGGPTGLGTTALSLAGRSQPAPAPSPPPPSPPPPPVPGAGAVTPPEPAAGPDPQRILGGPSGLGTAALSLALSSALASPRLPPEPVPAPPAEGQAVPGLYHHPIPEPDPVRVEEVSRRIKRWAEDEVRLYPEEWEGQFDGFSVGRYMVGCHPDAPTVDHLMIATRMMVAENAVDDCYCEDHGGSPVGLGGRLLLAHTALDPLHTTPEYAAAWEESLGSDAPRRAYRSAMDYFVRMATPSQADRFRHDMARLHLGYLAEAAWAETDHDPEVWEYLAMRQFNNFRPCPTITDLVGGYELPADLHARPEMQRVIALAGNATTIVNDLYSYTKELASPGRHLNLPVVLAERQQLSERDAYLKAVEIHNDLMHAFEAAAAELAAACPLPTVVRFLKGVATWVDGNHDWHRTNTYRYSLPDFW
ncbi:MULTISPECIES: family 2 encapsulin nanocompartment cargo protein terpene cyclase [Streptomyces]|uniref:family 2 encapsulin nanocompartment cargo protein terpene cyclase n=1 Tax=Streptomyces TaxID=1883 RepID=UPI00163CE14B|nr:MULTISPECIES: family 2 encapsulin nanocompartment cargo protein terpene cyclase [Streptomyces]MBC2877012.1 2-methylisoborneol synthase [Streptomyces sp. TYQ1024]UBI36036.1 2-methylisoborneol synthase [Streptomyces mobaraensis]UKW28629.1 2-methylisoborneol synthase [Streptomyces sp. TYQ1024]